VGTWDDDRRSAEETGAHSRVAAAFERHHVDEDVLARARIQTAAARPNHLGRRLSLAVVAVAIVAVGLAIADRTGLFLPPTARIVERALAAASSEVPSDTVVYERVVFEYYDAEGSLESSMTREAWRAADGVSARLEQTDSRAPSAPAVTTWLEGQPLRISFDASSAVLEVASVSSSMSAFQHAVLGDRCQDCHVTHYSEGEFELLRPTAEPWDSQRPYLEKLLDEEQVELTGREKVDGTECYVFERTGDHPAVTRLYVNVDDYSVVRYEYEAADDSALTARQTQTLETRQLVPLASLPETWFGAPQLPDPPYRLTGSVTVTPLAEALRIASADETSTAPYPVYWLGPTYVNSAGVALEGGGEFDIQIMGTVTDVLSGGEARVSYDVPLPDGAAAEDDSMGSDETTGGSIEETAPGGVEYYPAVRTMRWPTRPRSDGPMGRWERIEHAGRTVWVRMVPLYDPYKPDSADVFVPEGRAEIDFPEYETTAELTGWGRDLDELRRMVPALRPLNE
jgi:hypothetical protein